MVLVLIHYRSRLETKQTLSPNVRLRSTTEQIKLYCYGYGHYILYRRFGPKSLGHYYKMKHTKQNMVKCKSSKLNILITLLLLAGDVHLNPRPNIGKNISISAAQIESTSFVNNHFFPGVQDLTEGAPAAVRAGVAGDLDLWCSLQVYVLLERDCVADGPVVSCSKDVGFIRCELRVQGVMAGGVRSENCEMVVGVDNGSDELGRCGVKKGIDIDPAKSMKEERRNCMEH